MLGAVLATKNLEGKGHSVRVSRSLFLKLLFLLAVLPLLFSVLLAHGLKNPDTLLFRYTMALVGIVLFASITFLAIPVLLFFLVKGTWPSFFKALVGKAIVFLFPLILMIGKMLGICENRIRRSFVELNNYFVEEKKLTVSPGKLLLLLPHCLQDYRCPHKITRDPHNCRRCGRCPVADLLRLAERWQIEVAIVPGGTLARSVVVSGKPECVVAAACERDLSSGIIDSFPLPILGTLLDRPFGPCLNTAVSIFKLEENIKKLLPVDHEPVVTEQDPVGTAKSGK